MRYFVIDATDGRRHADRFEQAVETVDDPGQADALAVFGGDGAMLRAIQDYMHCATDFIGINAGTRGYLMNNTPDPGGFAARLDEVRFRELWLLEGTARTAHEEVRVHGFNDIWVERCSAQTLRMRLTVENKPQPPMLVGDGVLFSTPQGSTGYNLALRGKPICPSVPVIQVTPMSCVIDKAPIESLILSDRAVVTVDFEQISKRPGRLFYDGIHRVREPVESLTVRRGDRSLRLGFVEEYSCINKVLPWQLRY
jgi:NAD+ kinase